MSTWTDAVLDLRRQLSDNSNDKLRYRKRCIGQIDGLNKTFKTFEFRRVTDFVSTTLPNGVFVNGSSVSSVTDFPEIGEFVLAAAPSDGDVVEATYFIQWFTDTELQEFLIDSMQWLGLGTNYSTLVEGLRPCAKFYAAKQACEKLCLRWAEYQSDTYMFQEAPNADKRLPIDDYRRLAETYYKQAKEAQSNYYTRQGQNLQPLFANISGNIPDVTPKR